MIEFNRQGYNKKYDVYESYYMAKEAIRREEKNIQIEYKNGIKHRYHWKVIKINLHLKGTTIEVFKPQLQLISITEELLN